MRATSRCSALSSAHRYQGKTPLGQRTLQHRGKGKLRWAAGHTRL